MAQARLYLSLLTLLMCGAWYSAPAEAQSQKGWTLCNETSFIVDAAIGRPEAGAIVVEGWKRLRPGRCELALEGELQTGVHFLYGKTSEAHRGGTRHWGGDHDLCVDPLGSFAIETIDDCGAMGLDTRGFRPVLVESNNRWSTSFTETLGYSLDTAAQAGVQRLLDDAGVYSGKIDGVIGRRTRGAIGNFLRERNLPANTTDNQLIDLLERVAKDEGRNVGFTVCNRTRKRIWAAIARRAGENWESRGWWALDAGGCARTVDEPLLQSDHFVYAEMEEEDGSYRKLSRASDTFCIARAKFAITGRDNCEASAYLTALFTATPPPEEEKIVFEFFERDFSRAR